MIPVNKHLFGLLQQLADEFLTYCTAGHGKGAIDGMLSFEVKNFLRKDFVIYLLIALEPFY